ncbi:MAG TPA: arginine--tRNA ligase [Nitrososphaeraceae archaeon]|nr:arginine--tRNA ligase [Nitrososphaeraceae archaeon]
MTFSKVIDEIKNLLSLSFSELNYPSIEYEVTEPPLKEFGDLTSNIAFLLGKKLKRKPSSIANEIVEKVILPRIDTDSKDRRSLVLSAQAHIAGHINFKINYELFSKFLLEILDEEKVQFLNVGKGQRIIIEHTSVNPNKAIHIGHLRNMVIGDTLYRIFKSTNHHVTVLNYIDDSGVQFADIIVAFRFGGFEIDPPDKNIKFDHYCGDIYVKMNEIYQNNPYLAEKRTWIIKEIEKGNNEISTFTWNIVKKVMLEQLKTCWRMKARYDILNIESQILVSGLWEQTFNLLKEREIIRYNREGKNKDCWVIQPEKEEEKVIVRSDGTATYIAKDIPYATWKLGLVRDPFVYTVFAEQWDGTKLFKTDILDHINNFHDNNGLKEKKENDDRIDNNNKNSKNDKITGTEDEHKIFSQLPDKVITLIDSRQARLQNIISQIIQKLDTNSQKYYYLGYETVALSHQTVKEMGIQTQDKDKRIIHMSGRKGIFVNADNIIDELSRKAVIEIKSRNPHLIDSEIKVIAEGIAVSALRYSLIKQDLEKMITFDIKDALNLDGDTSLYLQYSYARAIRIIEKAESTEKEGDVKLHLLNQDIEKELIKDILKYEMVVGEALRTLSPKVIARYSNRIATKFNIFYESVPVLNEQNKEIMIARLTLVNSFAIVLKALFLLLGIEPFKRI